MPIPFLLFFATLLGVAIFHHHTRRVALLGLLSVCLYTIGWGKFVGGATGLSGFLHHCHHEWPTMMNLILLISGFTILADHFEKSHIPQKLPAILANDWKGGIMLIGLIFFLSSFLDNIAAALIGGSIAYTVYRGKVHTSFLVAIVAAANAGGTGSVIGDTTTTLMWIAGIHPVKVLPAYVGALSALGIFSMIAARAQHSYHPIMADPPAAAHLRWKKVFVTIAILVVAAVTNVTINQHFSASAEKFPFLGVAVWVAILAFYPLARPNWEKAKEAAGNAIFLCALVLSASMMPVETLPNASPITAFGLGLVSAVFDNIPLTTLALKQGGYNPAFLAYAVGFGGSITWFGSSAGVALAGFVHGHHHDGTVHKPFEKVKSLRLWLREGWHTPVAYVVGFVVLYLLVQW